MFFNMQMTEIFLKKLDNMEFSQPITKLIESRSSWRSYTSQSLEPELRSQIIEYINRQMQGPFGHNTRFQLIQKD